jgi:F-type H+-transporting ATPase subunit epsilon
MAEGTKLDIVSPERLLLSDTVRSVTVPGTEGYFTVLGEHAPLMTTLRPGFVTVTDSAGVSHVYFVRGGFADVSPEGLTILAEEAKPVAEFDRAEIEALIATGMSAVDAATTAEEQNRLRADLDDLRNLLLEAPGAATAH